MMSIEAQRFLLNRAREGLRTIIDILDQLASENPSLSLVKAKSAARYSEKMIDVARLFQFGISKAG